MFENAFERLGQISENHSGKLIIAWIALIVILAPFAGMLFGMTSYDISSGIVPSNSMANRADNLLSTYFPASGSNSSSEPTLVVVSTGTNVNDASVISSYLYTQSLLLKYLSGQGISGNITSIVTVEQSTLENFSTGALALVNATYSLASGLNGQLTQLNITLNSTLGMIYGIPAMYLSFLSQTGSTSMAYNLTVAQIGQSPVPLTYFNSFAAYFNSSVPSTPAQMAATAILNAVANTTSPYYMLSASNQPLQAISFSIVGNFTLGDFSLSTPSERAHYDSFVYNFSYASFVPELSSNATLSGFLTQGLNTSVASFFDTLFNLSQPATAPELALFAASLAGHGLIASLEFNPMLSVNPSVMVNYLVQLESIGATDQSINRVMQFSGFDGYPVVPSPYVFHNFVGYDNSTTVILISLSKNASASQTQEVDSVFQSGFSTIGGSRFYTSGSTVMNSQLASETTGGMIRALIIGIVLSILIVGLFFRSVVAAFLPLSMFGVSALTAFSLNALLYKYVLRTSISFITPTLLLILLLGLSTDYVVYIMSRFRSELRNGNPNPTIVSTKWAGHAVFTSGLTVSMSYVALWISNVPIFSDSGITNAIGVMLAVIVANTLLVSVLKRGGKRIFWPSKITAGQRNGRKGSMERLSGVVIRNKAKLLILFIVISLLSTYLYVVTPTNMDVFSLLPSGSGVTAIEVVNQSFHGDYFNQAYIILKFDSPLLTPSGYNSTLLGVVTAVEYSLISSHHVAALNGPTFPYGYYVPYNLSGIPSSQQSVYRTQMDKYIGQADSSYVLISMQLSALSWSPYSSNFVASLPSYLSHHDGSTFTIYVGGLAEGLNDAYNFTDGTFNNMIPILVFAILAVLAVQISALFTPMRLVLMVLASVILALAITYILLHYIYQLSLLIFLPMFTIITLLAVGLDYDIFMVSRVREEVMKGNSDQHGIVISMTENGGVIITLGAILFATFASLLFSGIGLMEEIGIGLAFGVLIDTFVSWPLFVPAVMLLLRKYNWWPSKLRGAGAVNGVPKSQGK